MIKEDSAQRAVIIHYHLFKCAGTSVEHVLEDCFGKRLMRMDYAVPFGKLFADDLVVELKKNHHIQAFTSHQLKMPLPESDGIQFLPLIFLRHPIDRIQSVYRFDRRRGPVTPDAEVAVRNDFATYLRIQMDADKQVKNFHVRSLTDAWELDRESRPLLPIGIEGHFERALEVMKSLPVVGLVEQFSKSAKTFEKWISTYFPEFQFPIAKQNVDPSRPLELEDRLEKMREEVGHSIFEELVEVNSFDFKLYESAKGLLDLAAQNFGAQDD